MARNRRGKSINGALHEARNPRLDPGSSDEARCAGDRTEAGPATEDDRNQSVFHREIRSRAPQGTTLVVLASGNLLRRPSVHRVEQVRFEPDCGLPEPRCRVKKTRAMAVLLRSFGVVWYRLT
jgi:hypothetical protein